MFEGFKSEKLTDDQFEILREMDHEELERILSRRNFSILKKGALEIIVDTEGKEILKAHHFYLIGDAILAEFGARLHIIDPDTSEPYMTMSDGLLPELGTDIRTIVNPDDFADSDPIVYVRVEEKVKKGRESKILFFKLRSGKTVKYTVPNNIEIKDL